MISLKLGYIDNMESKKYSGKKFAAILNRNFPGKYTEKYFRPDQLNIIIEKGNKYSKYFENLKEDILKKSNRL